MIVLDFDPRNVSQLLGSFDFDRILSRARGIPRLLTSPSCSLSLSFFGKVRFISGVVSTLGITPTDGFVVCRLVVRTASPSSSTDPKKERTTEPAHATTRQARELDRRKFDPSLFFDYLGSTTTTTRLISHRVCLYVRRGNHCLSALRGSDYFSRLTKCLVLSREISDPTLSATA